MEIADRAFIAQRNGGQALQLFEAAYRLEFEAAQQTHEEPSRSVLYRSAATLALHAQLYREAEKADALGLAGEAPAEIADELREVLKLIFQNIVA